MLQKNQTLTVDCTALGADFEGICRHEGQVIFVRGMLPGEKAQVQIIKVAKQYAVARLLALHTRSEARVEPPCPYYPRCGGCTAQHLSYAATLQHKRQQVYDCLERIGGFEHPQVLLPLGMDDPWRYRNKGAFPVGGTQGKPIIGIYAARSHDIVDAPKGCLLQTRQSDALVAAVRQWMVENAIQPYNEEKHTGLIRHIMTREAADGTALLIVVINGKEIPAAHALITRATAAAPGLQGIVLSENTRRTNVILGDTLRVLWEAGCLTDQIAGFSLRVSPRSFFQVNRSQAETLYATAIAWAGLTGKETVWDLYCGAGSISLPLSAHARQVTGVEIVEDAIADARRNAEANGVTNARFIAGATEEVLPKLLKEEGPADVVVLDPPRKGCEPQVLDAIVKASPERIVYVSCNPATLARDAKILAAGGYALNRVQPVDMFCWTGHVETVCLMTKVEKYDAQKSCFM